MLTPTCLCGNESALPCAINNLPMLRCPCGIHRQRVNMTPMEYGLWYATQYHRGVYYHTYHQDREVAYLRLKDYQLPARTRLLDVGSGNNAFVMAAREHGLDAWGQELATQAEGLYTYRGALADCAFPAGHYDVVTVHDVLEHEPNPRLMLREIARTLKIDGQLIIDWPSFWAPDQAGAHHWKETEHLWMLTDEQVAELLTSEFFTVERIEHPKPSRSVFYTRNRNTYTPAKILVPPGIGDGYWVLTQLRGFLEQHEMYLPEIYAHDAGPRRSEEFWKTVPFVRFGGYAALPKGPWQHRAYAERDYAIQTDVPGFDFFLSMNGALERGLTVDRAVPGPTEWYPRLFHSKDEYNHQIMFQSQFAPYVVVAFWDHGFYQHWLKEFNIHAIVRTLKMIAETGKRVVIMGATWDKDGIASRIARRDPRFVNLVGHTSYAALIGLLRGAHGIFGFPAGNTMMGAFLKKPTTLLWNKHFRPVFWRNVCPPDATHYLALPTRTIPKIVASRFLELIARAA